MSVPPCVEWLDALRQPPSLRLPTSPAGRADRGPALTSVQRDTKAAAPAEGWAKFAKAPSLGSVVA